ncbi:hypothetical protein Tco_0621752 [Tanacetum coccineum]
MLPRIEKMVNEQLEAEVPTCSSNESKTSHAVAANLSEPELKKILIDKMERNKSIHRSNEQTNLYNALVEDYESDKLILETYGETVTFKRRREDEDKDEEPSAGLNRGSKRRRAGKEPESTSALKEKTTKLSGKSNEGSKSSHKSAGVTEDQAETSHFPDWFQKPDKLPSPASDWNKTLPAAHGSTQPWLSILARKEDPQVYKATTEQLDWINPEDQQYPYDSRKPLPLIPNSRGRRVIPFDHFINNDLEYLSGGVSSRKYATSVTKTKAADYGHIKWIEDLVPNIMWSPVLVDYDKHALWGISHWGRKRQQLYGFVVNRESARDVYSKRRIIAVTKLEIVEWQNYKHLDWIIVRKLTNLTVEECQAFNVSLRILDTSAGNPVKEILLKLNLPDHKSILMDSKVNPTKHRLMTKSIKDKEFQRSFCHSDTERVSRSDEVLKLKNFKKDATLKLFRSTNQERYEHVGSKVTSSQDGKVHKMEKRDYAWLMISRCSKNHIQDKIGNGGCETTCDDVGVSLMQGFGELTLSSLDVLQWFSFFLQMGFTLILATLDGLDVGLLGDVIGEDDCDDDG